jgi:hypothetical protein
MKSHSEAFTVMLTPVQFYTNTLIIAAYLLTILINRGKSVALTSGYRIDDKGCWSSSRIGVKNVHFSTLFAPALRATQPANQRTLGLFP